jgi:UDPglucose 6-dehydrogenase
MNITIIGTGYVGLVTGSCLAELGNHVFCLDVDAQKIAILNGGGVPIHEPGLQDMIARNAEAGRLVFSTDVAASVAHGDVQFIAVGTPPDEDGSADLQYVLAAAANIGRHASGFKVVVTNRRSRSAPPTAWPRRSGRSWTAGLQIPHLPAGPTSRSSATPSS